MGFPTLLFGEKRSLKVSLIFLVICVILTALALIVGINDNIPGFIILVLGAFSMALVFVHGWRRSKKYGILALISLAGIFVSAILHNLFEGLGGRFEEMVIIYYLLAGIGVIFFFFALLVCPVGLVTGFFGFTILRAREYIETKKQPKPDNQISN